MRETFFVERIKVCNDVRKIYPLNHRRRFINSTGSYVILFPNNNFLPNEYTDKNSFVLLLNYEAIFRALLDGITQQLYNGSDASHDIIVFHSHYFC